jgi:hypothetical protein
MVTGILSVLSLGLGLLFWWLRRRAESAADPLEKNRKRYEQINTDIARALRSKSNEESLGAAAHGSADLDELERLQRSHGHERQ